MSSATFELPRGLTEVKPESSAWQSTLSNDSDDDSQEEYVVLRMPESISPRILHGLEIDWPPTQPLDIPLEKRPKNSKDGNGDLVQLQWDSDFTPGSLVPEARQMYVLLPNQEEGGFKAHPITKAGVVLTPIPVPQAQILERGQSILNAPKRPKDQPDMPYRKIFEPFGAHTNGTLNSTQEAAMESTPKKKKRSKQTEDEADDSSKKKKKSKSSKSSKKE